MPEWHVPVTVQVIGTATKLITVEAATEEQARERAMEAIQRYRDWNVRQPTLMKVVTIGQPNFIAQ